MNPDKIKDRKGAILYFLHILNEKNKPLDLGDFFLDSGYTKGIESFENIMEEMESKGWIIIKKIPSGSLPGKPYMRTNRVTYEISLDGVEYLKANQRFFLSRLIRNIKGMGTFKQILIGVIISVIAGIILIFLTPIFSNKPKNFDKHSEVIFRPYLELKNYKIKAQNKTYPSIDRLLIKAKYRGSQTILRKDIKIVRYSFIESPYFHKSIDYQDEPSLELLEVIIPFALLDSTNSETEIELELKRKMILDGNYMAWFKKEDKQIIGDISIAIPYSIGGEVLIDTLNTDIYIIK